MPVEPLSQTPADAKAAVQQGTRFPASDLASSIELGRILHVKGGGQATPEQLAAHLGYKGTNNGAYLTRIASAKSFQIVMKTGPVFQVSQLGYQILSPTYPTDAAKALVDAFLNIELFKRIYEDFKGRALPPEFGMKNALRHQYGVLGSRVNEAYRSLMESAETAGLFATKGGARTHLILPLIQPVPQGTGSAQAEPEDEPDVGGGGGGAGAGSGGNGEGQGGFVPKTQKDNGSGAQQVNSTAKDAYLNLLVRLLEQKSANGDLDEGLAERIERLLGLESRK